MGMSSSQARLLTLTARLHSIEHKAQKIEAEKLRLANDSDKVYETYLERLEATKIQYSTLTADGTMEFKDASYLDLMVGRPGSQYLMYTTNSNKVCLSQEILDIYNSATDANDFVEKLKAYRSTGSAGNSEWWGGETVANNTGGTTGGTTGGSTTGGTTGGSTTGGTTGGSTTGGTTGGSTTGGTTGGSTTGGTTGGSTTGGTTEEPETPPVQDPDFTVDDTLEEKTISRGQTQSINVSEQGIKLCYTNPLVGDGQKYYYDISSNSGTKNVNFKVLNNGRLVITGSGLTIKAYAGQKDDIILSGDNNTVFTGDMDDIVRSGFVIDDTAGTYERECSGNIINTGSGNDHVALKGGNNTINGGDGKDSYVIYPNIGVYSNNISNIEENSLSMQANPITNNQLGTSNQGSLGSCRFLSLMNSLGSDFNKYVKITANSSNTSWTVNLLKTGLSTTVSKSELSNVDILSGTSNYYSMGDADMRIVEFALNKISKQRTGKDLSQTSWQEYSRMLFNTPNVSMYIDSNDFTANHPFEANQLVISNGFSYSNQADFETKVKNNASVISMEPGKTLSKALIQQLWNKKNSGQISNLVVGANIANSNLQIITNHAYAVSNVKDDYIELINPWSNQDRLRLTWSDFMNNFDLAAVFGDTTSDATTNLIKYQDFYNGIGNSSTETYDSTDSYNFSPVSIGEYSQEVTIADSYRELYSIIGDAIASGNYELVPGDMVSNRDFLTNVINAGVVYLKRFDKAENKWHDTSVATTTELREVSNEINLKKAEAQYEADMRKINRKDRQYDTELAKFENERNAIKDELESLKNVAKENVDRTFKLFS